MPHLTFSSHIAASPEEVFEWHLRAATFVRLLDPWREDPPSETPPLDEGTKFRFRVFGGSMRPPGTLRVDQIVPGESIVLSQTRGPFRSWRHGIRVEPDGDGTRLEDVIDYSGGPLRTVFGRRTRNEIVRRLAFRHRRTGHELRLHHLYGGRRRLRIAISGSTGPIGRHLIPFFESWGHDVWRIVPAPNPAHVRSICCNHVEGIIEAEKLSGFDAVIHLPGGPAASPRWSEQRKIEIISSRIGSTSYLARSLARLRQPPRVFLSESSILYYGDRGSEILDEHSRPGDIRFLSLVAQDWERASEEAEKSGIRTVNMRFGVMLTPTEGFLRAVLDSFRIGLGGCYGERDQFLSWIALEDLLGAVYHLLTDATMAGPVNVTSPTPVTMSAFAHLLGRTLGRPAAMKFPRSAFRLVQGRSRDEAPELSIRAIPRRLQAAGFMFEYSDLEQFLRHTLHKSPEPFTLEGVHANEIFPTDPVRK